MRLLALTLALLAATAEAQPSIGGGGGGGASFAPLPPSATSTPLCQTVGDYGGNFIYHPEQYCCTTSSCATGASGAKPYKRWTRECVATFPNRPLTVIGPGFETSIALAATIKNETSTCFALDISGGAYTGTNQIAYIDAIDQLAIERGITPGPRFLEIRNDGVDLSDVYIDDPDVPAFDAGYLLDALLADRSWESTLNVEGGNGVIDFLEGLGGAWSGGVALSNFSRCRFPTTSSVDPDEIWDSTDALLATPLLDCNAAEYGRNVFNAAGTTELQRRAIVYYLLFRDASQRMFYPVLAMTDVTNAAYRAWLLTYIRVRMAREDFTGFVMNHKLQHYWNPTMQVRLEPWIATGDAEGGAGWRYCDPNMSSATYSPVFTADAGTDVLTYSAGGDIATYTEVNVETSSTLPAGLSADTSYWTIRQSATSSKLATSLANAMAGTAIDLTSAGSGTHNIGSVYFTTLPQLILCDGIRTARPHVGATEFVYPDYVEGLNALGDEAYASSPRMPYLITVNPYWYNDCSAGTMAGDFVTGMTCDDIWDDPASAGVNEAALIREMVQKAGYVAIDEGGQGDRAVSCAGSDCTGGIGSGSGSGLTAAQLKALIESGTPTPIRVEIIDTAAGVSTAPKVQGRPQINPESLLTP